jgi:hypothetical protein
VSLNRNNSDGRVAERYDPARGVSRRDVEPVPTAPEVAKAALDRIVIPSDVADRIAGLISPRSSVIVSDEALSPETGKGTDFIVIMSDEPQGGIKFRRRDSYTAARRERIPYGQPSYGQPSWGPSPFRFPW